jgi:hypothetical protein
METLEVDMFAAGRILWRRIWIVLGTVVIFVVFSAIRSMGTAPVFRSDAIVTLPQLPGSLVIKQINESTRSVISTQIVNVAETRELLQALAVDRYRPLLPYVRDSAAVGDLVDILVDELYGTDRFFRLAVKVRRHPQSAPMLMAAMLAYLQHHPLVTQRMVDARSSQPPVNRSHARNHAAVPATPRAAGLSAMASPDPLAYQFVREPVPGATPVSPRPWINALLMGFVGLLLGSLCAIGYDVLAGGKGPIRRCQPS